MYLRERLARVKIPLSCRLTQFCKERKRGHRERRRERREGERQRETERDRERQTETDRDSQTQSSVGEKKRYFPDSKHPDLLPPKKNPEVGSILNPQSFSHDYIPLTVLALASSLEQFFVETLHNIYLYF